MHSRREYRFKTKKQQYATEKCNRGIVVCRNISFGGNVRFFRKQYEDIQLYCGTFNVY